MGQTGSLAECDARRALGVAAMDMHNAWADYTTATLKPTTAWDRVRGKTPELPPKPSLNERLLRP